METLKAIRIRKSTRSFKAEQITAQELNTILDAGKSAPTAGGVYQNVHLTVVQNAELLEKINRAARIAMGSEKATANYNASTLIVVSVKEVGGAEKANAGCVMENMLLAATDLGLGNIYTWAINFVGGDAEVMGALELPANFTPVSAVALGYPNEPITQEREPYPMSVNIVR